MNNKEALGRVMLDEETIAKRVKELGEQISADYDRDFNGEPVVIVCILKGACIFASDLLKKLTVDARIDFMAVSSYGASTKSTGVVKINKDLDTSIEGKNILIVEDIIDTGLTLHYLIKSLWGRNPKSIKVCTLLDKPERRKVEMTADYIGFEIENKFIVGYGLEYDEKYRNLPYITCLD